MKTKTLEAKAAIQISKPVYEVFEAIVDPAQMTNYFISKSSGRMEENKKIMWKFPEFHMEAPIRCGKIEKNKLITFYWDNDSVETFTEITLSSKAGNSTLVSITEKNRENDEAGIKWLIGNTD